MKTGLLACGLVGALSLSLALGGCKGDQGDAGSPGEAGAAGAAALIAVTPQTPGPNCPNGGQRIDSGVDDNGDGVLQAEEITSTAYLCDGRPGPAGSNGSAGEDGGNGLIAVTVEAAGANCAAGGHRIDAGVDDNGDGLLQASEVDSSVFVCDGVDGADNDNLVLLTIEASGSHCHAGGQRIDVGLDEDGDGALEPGEVEATSFVCNGENGASGLNSLVNIGPEAAGDNCLAGGQRLESGLDDNSDGVLEAGEIDLIRYLCNGVDGSAGLNSLVNVTIEAAGDNCASGGQKVESGVDDNSDAVLDAGEVDLTRYVCNGSDGIGYNSLVVATDEAAGDNCTDGGQRIDTGVDADASGALESGEIAATSFVCNGAVGAAGTNGSNGLNSLVNVTAVSAGSDCAAGGQKVESGLDDNRDGVLQAGEVDQIDFVCDGAAGASGSDGLVSLVKASTVAAGSDCAAGGQKIESGLDDDRDGILQAGEVDQTSFVCDGTDGANGTNGTNGSNGLNSLVVLSTEVAGPNCANGGQKVESGLDDNRDGTLQPGEVDLTSYVCDGANGSNGTGYNSLVVVTVEPVSGNCSAGGQRIDAGLDDNSNGALEAGEIDRTSYVCDGIDGSNGSNGSNGLTSLVVVTTENPGTTCPAGGKKIESGLDDDRSGVLEPGEVDATHYVCNGVAGTNGTNGTNGSNGFNSLVSISIENPGTTCPAGGKKVESGLDDNRNGLLELGEVDATNYVCNGVAGTNGNNGSNGLTSLVVLTVELPGANCVAGGHKLESGVDDSGNGLLEPGEVDFTRYVCSGSDCSAHRIGAIVSVLCDDGTSASWDVGLAASTATFGSGGTLGADTWNTDVALGDLDGDGDLDVYAANTGADKVYFNNGDGTFVASAQTFGSDSSPAVAIGDLDGDRDLDLFVVNPAGNLVLLNDGRGQFAAVSQALPNSDGNDGALGDLDGDGDLDAFVVNRAFGVGASSTVWHNDGTGHFTDSGQALGAKDGFAVALGDIDGDGDLDAVQANYNPGGNLVWLNDGSGAFSDSGQTLGTAVSSDVELGDIDGDGDLDVLISNESMAADDLWINDGTGTFSVSAQVIGNNGNTRARLADLDGDGDLDLALGTAWYVQIWTNEAGTFTNKPPDLGTGNCVGVDTGDLDGDGDLDLAVANWNALNSYWFNE